MGRASGQTGRANGLIGGGGRVGRADRSGSACASGRKSRTGGRAVWAGRPGVSGCRVGLCDGTGFDSLNITGGMERAGRAKVTANAIT